MTLFLNYREEELQLEKRNKKRKIKGSSRLSFAEDFENGSDEDDGENSKWIDLSVSYITLSLSQTILVRYLKFYLDS